MLAVVILIGLGIAAVTFVDAQRTYFWALLSTPAAGAYGTSWADLPPPEIRAKARAEADALYEKAAWTQRVSLACATLSLAGIVVAAWRNRRGRPVLALALVSGSRPARGDSRHVAGRVHEQPAKG